MQYLIITYGGLLYWLLWSFQFLRAAKFLWERIFSALAKVKLDRLLSFKVTSILSIKDAEKLFTDDADQFLPSLRESQSYIEYLLCTRICGDELSQLCSSPLIGFRVTELPCYMVGLSSAGEFITMPLTSTTLLPKTSNFEESTVPDGCDSQLRVSWISNLFPSISA